MNVHGSDFPSECRAAWCLCWHVRDLLEGLPRCERSAFDIQTPEFEVFNHLGGGAGETNQIKDEKGIAGMRSARLNIPQCEFQGGCRLLAEILPVETKIRAHVRLAIFFAFIDDLSEVANDAPDAKRGSPGLFGDGRKNA